MVHNSKVGSIKRKDVLYKLDFMEEMSRLGANVQEGISRVMDDSDLYKTMLGMFVDTLEKEPVTLEDFDKDDLESAIKRVHTLKGITGNLSITPLYEGYMEVLTLLRKDEPKEAKAIMAKVLPKQEEFVACIKRHQG